MKELRFILNGKPVCTQAGGSERLLDVLYGTLSLTGTIGEDVE